MCEVWGQNQVNYYLTKLIINFTPQTSPSDCIFKEKKILQISDFVNYKYALLVTKSLSRENVEIFNDMFTPLNQNHNEKHPCCYKLFC